MMIIRMADAKTYDDDADEDDDDYSTGNFLEVELPIYETVDNRMTEIIIKKPSAGSYS